jgi:hypothetical protein
MRKNSHGAWATEAIHKTKKIEREDPWFRNGTKNILKTFREIAKNKK